MLPVNYRSWQHSFSELSKSCKQWGLTFFSTKAFRAIKILLTMGADIRVDRSFQTYQNLGIENISFLGPKIRNLYPKNFKNINSLENFKILIQKWKLENCPSRLCKVYIKYVGFL